MGAAHWIGEVGVQLSALTIPAILVGTGINTLAGAFGVVLSVVKSLWAWVALIDPMVIIILGSIALAIIAANTLADILSKIPVPPPEPEIPIEWGGTAPDPDIPGVDWNPPAWMPRPPSWWDELGGGQWGGPIGKTGLYRLHKGEYVQPVHGRGGGTPGGNVTTITNVILDGRTIARQISRAQGRDVRSTLIMP